MAARRSDDTGSWPLRCMEASEPPHSGVRRGGRVARPSARGFRFVARLATSRRQLLLRVSDAAQQNARLAGCWGG